MHKVLFVLALVITLPAVAQSAKKPWMLTVEERIALRTNPGLAQERIRSRKQIETSSVPTMGPETRPLVDAFNGKTHPELFLPYEVFAQFVDFAFRTDARGEIAAHRALAPDVKRLGLPADFFGRLRTISSVYISDRAAEREIGQGSVKLSGRQLQRAEEALALKRNDLCHSRAEALADARSAFGRERFDRFLYEIVAVNMFTVTDRQPDPELLRRTEEGCR